MKLIKQARGWWVRRQAERDKRDMAEQIKRARKRWQEAVKAAEASGKQHETDIAVANIRQDEYEHLAGKPPEVPGVVRLQSKGRVNTRDKRVS